MISQPRKNAVRATARTAAFIPGASPPLVKTAILNFVSSRSVLLAANYTNAPGQPPAGAVPDALLDLSIFGNKI